MGYSRIEKVTPYGNGCFNFYLNNLVVIINLKYLGRREKILISMINANLIV